MQRPDGMAAGLRVGDVDSADHDAIPVLKNLFPNDNRDLDSLFPEPEMRRLLYHIAGDLRSVEKFVSRINADLKTERN